MKNSRQCYGPKAWLTGLLMSVLLGACGGGSNFDAGASAAAAKAAEAAAAAAAKAAAPPTLLSSSPSNGAINVPTSTNTSSGVVTGTMVSATFDRAMNPSTLNSSPAGSTLTFTLKDGAGNDVPGTVALNAAATVASFTPSAVALNQNTVYTATISTAARSAAGTAIEAAATWSFTTSAAARTGRAPVDLGTAGNFVVLAKSGISTVPNSVLTGDIGVSPIAGTAITGFSETRDASNTFATSTQVTGKIFAANYAPPTPATMTTAIGDMEIAYSDAAARTLPDFTALGSGEIGGKTLAPGLYKWSTGVSISTNVTLEGSADDVWIFQISGNLTQAAATRVTLAGGALAKNVFWQVGGDATLGTTAHFEGNLMSATAIALRTGASANGTLMAQTAVTLDQSTVTQPAK